MSRWCDLSLLWFRYGRGAPYNLVIKPVTSQFYEIKKSSWSRIRQNSWRVFTSDIWTWCWLSETEPETRVAACPKWLKHRLLSGPYLTRLWEKKKEAVAVRAIELNHHISLVVSQKHHQLPWPELNSQPVAWTNDIFDLNTSFMLTMTTDSQGRREAGGQNAKVPLPTHHQSTRPTYWASHSVIWLGLCCQDEWIQEEDARLVGPWPHDIHPNMETGRRTGHTEEAAQDSYRCMRQRERKRDGVQTREDERLNLPPGQPVVQQRGGGNQRHILATCGKQKQSMAWVRAVPSAVKQTRFVYNRRSLSQYTTSDKRVVYLLYRHFEHIHFLIQKLIWCRCALTARPALRRRKGLIGEMQCLCWDYSLFVAFSAEGLDLNS